MKFNILPTFGFLSAIWAIAIAIVVLVIVSYLTQPNQALPAKI